MDEFRFYLRVFSSMFGAAIGIGTMWLVLRFDSLIPFVVLFVILSILCVFAAEQEMQP